MKRTLVIALLIATLFATNTLNAWKYGIALNNVGGIDETGLFLCPSAIADLFPSLVVDC